jgi:predicted DNA-binding transcriptional regulator AlpA
MNDADTYLPSVQVAARYGICLRTLYRWAESETLELPKPLWINRRRFWRLADLQAWERRRVACKSMEAA